MVFDLFGKHFEVLIEFYDRTVRRPGSCHVSSGVITLGVIMALSSSQSRVVMMCDGVEADATWMSGAGFSWDGHA